MFILTIEAEHYEDLADSCREIANAMEENEAYGGITAMGNTWGIDH